MSAAGVFEKVEEVTTKAMGEIVGMLSRDYGIEAAVRELCALARGDVFYYRDGLAMTEAGLSEDEPFPERALGLDEIGTFPPDPGDQGTRYVLPGGHPA